MSASPAIPVTAPATAASRRTIPFDYSFHYVLDGELNKTYTQTITISIEAAFTALSIGYGVIPASVPVQFGPEQIGDLAPIVPTPPTLSAGAVNPRIINLPIAALQPILAGRTSLQTVTNSAIRTAVTGTKLGLETPLASLSAQSRNVLIGSPLDVTLGSLIQALARSLGEDEFTKLGEIGPQTQVALLSGFQLNPEIADSFLGSGGTGPMDSTQLARLFQTIGAPSEAILFLYALRDEGTGRELQSEPLLNISGLGIADGDRPFRPFAIPITFAPRSNIRLDIIAKSQFRGELFVSLHGYKVLGGTGTPTGRALRRRQRFASR